MERTKRAVNPIIASVKRASSEASKGAQRLRQEVRKLKWYCITIQACVERQRCNCKTASARMFNALLEQKAKGIAVKEVILSAGKSLLEKAPGPNIGVQNSFQRNIIDRSAAALSRLNLVNRSPIPVGRT